MVPAPTSTSYGCWMTAPSRAQNSCRARTSSWKFIATAGASGTRPSIPTTEGAQHLIALEAPFGQVEEDRLRQRRERLERRLVRRASDEGRRGARQDLRRRPQRARRQRDVPRSPLGSALAAQEPAFAPLVARAALVQDRPAGGAGVEGWQDAVEPQGPDLVVARRPRQVEPAAESPQDGVQEPEERLVLLLLAREGVGDLGEAGHDGAALRVLLEAIERFQQLRPLDPHQIGALPLEVAHADPAQELQIAAEAPPAPARSLGDAAQLPLRPGQEGQQSIGFPQRMGPQDEGFRLLERHDRSRPPAR